MSVRVQVVMEPEERDGFRRCADRAGKTLSAWLREAARDRELRESAEARLRTPEALDDFFAECDARGGEGREPAWEDVKRMIGESKLRGTPRDP